MKFGKCMGTLGVIEGRLYAVWEVYGDLRGSYWVVHMRFGKCMGTLGGHKGWSFICGFGSVWGLYGGHRGFIYEV